MKHRRTKPLTFETVRQIAVTLPGAQECTSYGTPAFKVAGKLFVRLHQDGESLVLQLDAVERTRRMEADPDTFYITDHYTDTPWMLVRLATVKQKDLKALLTESWRRAAPSRLLVEL